MVHTRELTSKTALVKKLATTAGIITDENVSAAFYVARNSGSTLERSLVDLGFMSEDELNVTQRAADVVATDAVLYERAAQALKHACDHAISFDEAWRALQLSASSLNRYRLGELLTAAGIIPEGEAAHAADLAKEFGKRIGEILVEFDIVRCDVLYSALHLQNMVFEGRITNTQAEEILKQVHLHGVTVDHVLSEVDDMKHQVTQLLKLARLVSDADICSAIKLNPEQAHDKLAALIAGKVVDRQIIRAAVRCILMIVSQRLEPAQAASVLKHCHLTGMGVNEAIADLTWSRIQEAQDSGPYPQMQVA